MKHLNSHVLELRSIAVLIASFVVAATSEADLQTTIANTVIIQPGPDAVWQPGPTTLSVGNASVILENGLIQNFSGSTPIFAGNAFTGDSGAGLQLNGTSPETLIFPGMNGNAGLIFNGGKLQIQDNYTLTIAGQIAVATNSVIDLGWLSGGLVITAQLSGGGNLNLISWNPANSMDIQSTNNPYSGNWLVAGGYLKGTAVNSLGTGNITISNGTLEISYDIQTPGALTLLGSNSVMVLHQDCQFSAVTINGTALPIGTYSYADLAAHFPVNFADGGSGSIAVAIPMQTDVQTSAVSPATDDIQSNSTSITPDDASPVVADVPAVIDSVDALVAPLIDTVAPAVSSAVTVLVDSSSQITLSWNPATDSGGSGIAGYRVYRGGLNVGTTTTTSYTDTGLTAGTQYCYTIVGYDNAGNNSSASAMTCATTPGTSAPPIATAFNEWYGPFASWTNVMAFGAKCDGVTDDSVAVSNALAVIGTGHCSPVLLIPGMCRVTKKPWLHNRAGVEVVGLNRDTCGFFYDGPADSTPSGISTCFHVDGVQQSYFARLKFDGNRKSETVFSCSEQSGFFDCGNVFEDCIIKNSVSGGIGLDCGRFGTAFANEDFIRCLIQTNTIGVSVDNWNALDGWFTDCLIEANTQYGIYVNQGGVHAYHSLFQHNGTDFYQLPGAVFLSLVSNTFYQSGTVLVTVNQGANTTPILFKGNTIIDPAGVPIQIGQFGPLFLLDNTILSTFPTVNFSNGGNADLLAVGNTNGVANWATYASGTATRSNLVDNFVVPRSSLTFALPGSPVAATNLNRVVHEEGTSMTASQLQADINNATDGSVFHIPCPVQDVHHQLYPNSTVTVPAAKDVRIVGDGGDTILLWSGQSGGTIFSCPTPSHATFSHLAMNGNSGTAGNLISVSGVGSTAARVYLRACSANGPYNANILLGDCPNAIIDVAGNAYGGGNSGSGPTAGRNVVLSGHGKVHYIDADGGGNATSFVSSGGGQLYVENSYNEASDTTGNKLLSLSGSGTVTFLGSKMVENIGSSGENFSRATGSGFSLANFTGQFSMIGIHVIDYLNLSGSTTGPVWVEGGSVNRDPVSAWPINNSTSDTPIQTMNYQFQDASGTTRLPDAGTASAAFTRQMLTQARAEYADRTPMSRRTNQTDVLLEQVFFSLGTQNLGVTP